MSELPKTGELENAFVAVNVLLNRIAELEADNRHLVTDLACWKHSGAVTFDSLKRAEDALAERERMLRVAAYHAWESGSVGMGIDQMPEGYPDFYLADLRARAEEGSEDHDK